MADAMLNATVCCISAVTYVQSAVLTDSNKNPVLSRKFDDLLRDLEVRIDSVTPKQAELARQAYRDFGKGRHKAGLILEIVSRTR